MRNFRAILAQDGTETAEGWMTRVFPSGCFEWRDLPLPMRFTPQDEGGHYGAVVIGRIDTIAMDGNLVVATGILDDEGEGDAADLRRDVIRQIDEKIVNGISVDPGAVDVQEESECTATDEDGFCTESSYRLTFVRYQIAAATVVPVPALEGTLIELDPAEPAPAPAAADAVAASAAAALDAIPAAWLAEPADLPAINGPDGRVPQITDDGRVFGYLAAWSDCHVAFTDRCQTPWRSQSNYEFALHCGPFDVDDGSRRRLAPLAVQGGHYPTQGVDPSTGERYAKQWQLAAAHYDDPRSCAAYVTVGENEHGIWYSGALRQGVTDEQIALLRRHQLSGDWRTPSGNMELVGMCSVNFPGFVRQVALTASADGSFEVEAAVIVSRGAVTAAASSCCDACAASGGHCADHPSPDLAAEVARLRSLVDTLVRQGGEPIRAKLRAQLAGAST